MPTAYPRRRVADWSRLERSSPEEQKRFLDNCINDFSFEPIFSETKVEIVKKGDHLVMPGKKSYQHHFLCTGVWYDKESTNSPQISVIEYTFNPPRPWQTENLIEYFGRILLTDLSVIGEIKKKTYTYDELKDTETLRVIWPKDLKRFDADEVVERAERRHGESYYDILKNNCEHFVTWCKCGLKVSLQVRDWYIKARDAGYSVCAGVIEYVSAKKVKPLVVKAAVAGLANVSDEIAQWPLLANAGAKAGFAVGGILELLLAAYRIKQANNQYRKGDLIKSEKELTAKKRKILAKGGCRFTGGCVGSVVGSAMGPVGSWVGGALGAGIGHLVGCWLGDYFTS